MAGLLGENGLQKPCIMSTKPNPKAKKSPEIITHDIVIVPEQLRTPAKGGKTKEITFLRSHPGFGYWPGDTAEVDTDKATELIAGGFAK